LEIDVTNVWANRLIGDAALPENKRFTKTNVLLEKGDRTVRPFRGYGSTDPLIPSGLLGPVRLVFGQQQAAGIGVNVHYIPVHTQPYYQDIGFRRGDFPEAEHYYMEALSLPLYPGLSTEEQDRVVDALAKAIQ
jgi:hypothetical protein